jgi:hypothetical protein
MNSYDLAYLLFIIVAIAVTVCYLEWDKISNYINNPEKLVAIVRIPFSASHVTYSSGDYDSTATKQSTTYHLADVYCYEKENGRRALVINAYNFSGSLSLVTSQEDYVKLIDWKKGRSNLFNFPSYHQVINGTSIIEKKD